MWKQGFLFFPLPELDKITKQKQIIYVLSCIATIIVSCVAHVGVLNTAETFLNHSSTEVQRNTVLLRVAAPPWFNAFCSVALPCCSQKSAAQQQPNSNNTAQYIIKNSTTNVWLNVYNNIESKDCVQKSPKELSKLKQCSYCRPTYMDGPCIGRFAAFVLEIDFHIVQQALGKIYRP